MHISQRIMKTKMRNVFLGFHIVIQYLLILGKTVEEEVTSIQWIHYRLSFFRLVNVSV